MGRTYTSNLARIQIDYRRFRSSFISDTLKQGRLKGDWDRTLLLNSALLTPVKINGGMSETSESIFQVRPIGIQPLAGNRCVDWELIFKFGASNETTVLRGEWTKLHQIAGEHRASDPCKNWGEIGELYELKRRSISSLQVDVLDFR